MNRHRVALAAMQQQVRDVNEANGWFNDQRSFGDGQMLIVTENLDDEVT